MGLIESGYPMKEQIRRFACLTQMRVGCVVVYKAYKNVYIFSSWNYFFCNKLYSKHFNNLTNELCKFRISLVFSVKLFLYGCHRQKGKLSSAHCYLLTFELFQQRITQICSMIYYILPHCLWIVKKNPWSFKTFLIFIL